LWLDRFVDKIIRKHNAYPDEVEEVLSSEPTIRKVEKGDVKGENLYIAFGKTNGGDTSVFCSFGRKTNGLW
jgi:hypothetical protein